MGEQNYKNHRRFVKLYHFFTSFLIIGLMISSIYYAIVAANNNESLKPSLFIFLISIILLMLFFFARTFALKAQDRAIRAEEVFRYYILTGRVPDSKLTIRQFIALRFASDDEMPGLAEKAVRENLSEEDIKKEIKNWRADNYRV